MRRYHGFMADSSRWERFELRADDVIITTPSKCGTTWMQNIVGMLIHDTTDLGVPINTISPWLDQQIHTEQAAFELLGRQAHRRFIKTHTPLDGLPDDRHVTYIAVIRHPLDVALSDLDHASNMDRERTEALRTAAVGRFEGRGPRETAPTDPAGYLRWFIDNENEPTGSGPYGLADFCQQALTYWDARHVPNVHLFHYSDMWNDLDAEMRRVAEILEVAIDESRWPAFVEAASIASMRSRAEKTAPNAEARVWHSTEDFFRKGGTREWASLLTERDVDHFQERLRLLAGGASDWILHGRSALAAH